MNSSRLRRVRAAPKLAMTRMMTALRRARSGPKRRASTRSARPAVRAAATSAARGSDQPKEKGAIGRGEAGGERAEGAGEGERDVGAPGDEVAVGEVGEAQDRVGEGDADGAEADHRPGDGAVEEDLRGHARALPRPAGAEVELGDDRVVGEGGGGALVGDAALDEDDGAVGDGERGA